jgi:hypothetical protein
LRENHSEAESKIVFAPEMFLLRFTLIQSDSLRFGVVALVRNDQWQMAKVEGDEYFFGNLA